MPNGEGNENGIKINRSNEQKKKKKLHVQHTFFLIRKKKICTCSTLFVFLCLCFAQLHRCLVGLKRQTSSLHIIFMDELSYVLTNILSPVFMFAFIFHCRSFSPCWPLAFLFVSQSLWISCISFYKICLFSITRSSSFCVIHVSVNIEKNIEKDKTLLLFFLCKSPGGHGISFQIKPWVAFGLPYLSTELFYIGIPAVRRDGRPVGVR